MVGGGSSFSLVRCFVQTSQTRRAHSGHECFPIACGIAFCSGGLESSSPAAVGLESGPCAGGLESSPIAGGLETGPAGGLKSSPA
jgi:hypothetical protein